MPNWTKQQEQAIRARNHTILVSAAAGSCWWIGSARFSAKARR